MDLDICTSMINNLDINTTLFFLGWEYDRPYRFNIVHDPDSNHIRVKIWEGGALMADSGEIVDNGENSLKGGRVGVYVDSQEGVTWSALSYR